VLLSTCKHSLVVHVLQLQQLAVLTIQRKPCDQVQHSSSAKVPLQGMSPSVLCTVSLLYM
jgi:hypothetical protein